MHIGNVNKNNFAWHKTKQIADINKKYTQQTKQPDLTSEEAQNPIKDLVLVSDKAKEKAKAQTQERKKRNELEDLAASYQELMDQLEKAREQGEAMAESMRVRMKCLLIAMRIMSGDKVPNEDYRYLAKNDLELYSKAVSMRIERENPQKHKRLSKDEESSGEEGTNNNANAETLQIKSGEIQAKTSPDSSASSESIAGTPS